MVHLGSTVERNFESTDLEVTSLSDFVFGLPVYVIPEVYRAISQKYHLADRLDLAKDNVSFSQSDWQKLLQEMYHELGVVVVKPCEVRVPLLTLEVDKCQEPLMFPQESLE